MKKTNCTRILFALFVVLMSLGVARAQVSVTATGGTTTATYTTLNAAFTAINGGTHTGAIIIGISANTTETGACVLNSSGAGSASYTSILIRPTADGVSISGPTATGRGLIELNGADKVTINGDNPNTSGINRNLSIINTAAASTTFTSVVRLALSSTVTSADNDTVKNCIITGSSTAYNNSSNTGNDATSGILAAGRASTTSATAAPSAITNAGNAANSIASGQTILNFTVDNNQIMSCGRGIAVIGTATSVCPVLTITNNQIGNATSGAANGVYWKGILAQGFGAGTAIRSNTVYVESYMSTANAIAGIDLGSASATGTGAVIEKNIIGRVRNIGDGNGAVGISLGAGDAITVKNNFIYNLMNAGDYTIGTTRSVQGIRVASGNNHLIYHNSVSLYGTDNGYGGNLITCLSFTGTSTTGCNVRNNIFSNTATTSSTDNIYACVYFDSDPAGSGMGLVMNNNAYYTGAVAGLHVLGQVGEAYGSGAYTAANFIPGATTPATNWRSISDPLAAGNDTASFATTLAAPFTSATNLHIPAGTATQLESGGASTGVTTDIDDQARPGPAGSVNGGGTAPDMGADEFDAIPSRPPAISATASAVNCSAAVSHTITANISTVSGTVTTVVLNYNNGTAGTITMTLTSGTSTNGVWSGTIPAGTAALPVTWSISATNSVPLSTTYIGATYIDVPLSSATAAISGTSICAGSSDTLKATLTGYGSATIGSGNTTLYDDGLTPFGQYFEGQHTQYLILASDLVASGLRAGNLSSLTFNIAYKYSSLPFSGYTIKIAATNATSLAGGTLSPTFTTVYGPTSISTTAGDNIFPFTNLFNWNGTSNLLVDICFQNDPGGTGTFYSDNDEVTATDMPYTCTYGYYDDNSALCGNTGPDYDYTTTLPLMKFNGIRLLTPTAYSWSNGTAVVGTSNPQVVNPTANTTYTGTLTALGCSINTNPVSVTVVALPAAPSATNSSQCGLGVPTASVSGGTGIYKWYSAALGGTLLQRGGSTYATAISTTTTFYVADSSGLCESARTAVTVTVTTPDAVTAKANGVVAPASTCVNTPVNLTATKTGTANSYTYTWTASPVAGSGIPAGGTAGQNIAVTPTAGGTYIYTVTGVDGSCATASTVSITIKAPFSGATITATATSAGICIGKADTLSVTAINTQPQDIFTEPFESTSFPLTTFAVSGGSSSATKNTTYFSQGTSSVLLNTTATSANANLTMSNALDLTGYSAAKLTFSHIAGMEGDATAYDIGYVQYSTNGGTSWTTFPASSYAGSGTLVGTGVSFSALSYANWTSTFSSTTSMPTNSLWQNETINIPAAALTSAQFKIRFRYSTDISNNYYGWLIDNVKISGAPLPSSYSWSNGSTVVGTTNPLSVSPTTTTTYTASLTISGCTTTSNAVTVTVNQLPTATITPGGTASLCAGSSGVVLTANTGTGFTYQWFNGTTQVGTGQTYTATAAGNYTVKVTNSTSCSATSAATVVSVTPLPTATLTAQGPVTFCTGGSVVLKSSTGTGYTYSWSNGTTIPGATDSTYTVTQNGNYTVTVSANGCSATSSAVSVSVLTPPTATITAGGPLTFCQGNGVTLTANSGTGYTYQWYNGTTLLGTTQAWFATASGSYTVVVSNGYCSTTSTARVVTVLATPTATITPAGPTSFCIGGSVILNANTGTGLTYRWFNGATQVGTGSSYTATTSGSYTVRVTNTNGCNTTSSAVVVTVFALPVAVITPLTSTVICQGETATLSAGTGTGLTYQWFNNSVAIAGATNNTLTTGAAGNYTVRITNANGCVATSASVLIEVVQLPGATITYTTPLNFCNGNSVVLSANTGTGFTYQWNHDGTPVAGATNATYTATTAGNYTVDVRNSNGCLSTSAAVTVTVYMLSTPIISRNGAVLSSTGYAAYQWYLNGTAIPGATNASYTVTQNGYYTVEGTDANGCVNMSAIAQWPNLGVGNTAGGKDLKIYPNPTTSILYIDAPVTVDASVSSLDGKELIYQKEAKQVDLGNLADGVYMLKILDQNKVVLKIEKLIKASK
ncbi:T9SS type A sorting domain-containing protein [Chitinophagaceae bacterium MMS25-I14]